MISRYSAIFIMSLALSGTLVVDHLYAEQSETAQVENDSSKLVELDPLLVTHALDTYIALSKAVGAEQLEALFEDTTEENLTILVPELKKILADNDFSNEEDWLNALQSVIVTYEALQGDSLSQSQEALNEIQEDPYLTAEQKVEFLEALKAMIPSKNSLQVMKELLKDPATSEKLAQILQES